jgi:hypothetical protein
MWPSGDYIDRSSAIGVTILARLRMTTRGNPVLRLIVASLNHWLSFHRPHPLACCYVFWIRHIFSDCHHARACLHTYIMCFAIVACLRPEQASYSRLSMSLRIDPANAAFKLHPNALLKVYTRFESF